MKNERRLKLWSLGLIGFHFLAVVLHSAAHEILAVKATASQLAFVFPVIVFAPVAAALLILKFERAGSWLMALSLTGSFFFGLYYHFIAMTRDHVAHVAGLQPAHWSLVFIATAYLLAFSEALGALAGFLMLRKNAQFFKDYAARTNF